MTNPGRGQEPALPAAVCPEAGPGNNLVVPCSTIVTAVAPLVQHPHGGRSTVVPQRCHHADPPGEEVKRGLFSQLVVAGLGE